jgi:hypothetical protein
LENAQNAFPTPPTAVLDFREDHEDRLALARGHDSDDTYATYRVAGFETFLTGRI